MSATSRGQNDSATVKGGNVKPSLPILDDQTARLLRSLGEMAIRLAEGQPIDGPSIAQYFSPAIHDLDDEELLTVPEACERLRVSRWMFYRLIQQRRLTTVTIGRRRLVPTTALGQFLERLRAEGATL